MTNLDIIRRAEKLACVLPLYVRADLTQIVTLAGEQATEIIRLQKIVNEQREHLALLRKPARDVLPDAAAYIEAYRETVL